jgi:Plant specific eukaryotic initiation factor 4B
LLILFGLFWQNDSGPVVKSKGSGSNPFGAARPREEVLAEKGQDWRELEEKLQLAKIGEEKPSFSKKTIGTGNGTTGTSEDRTEQAWRKPVNSAETECFEPTETPRSVNFFHYTCSSLYVHVR